MIFYPECQAKAQEEIDHVIGSKRLPEFEDRESLPYVECLMQEAFRYTFPYVSFGSLLKCSFQGGTMPFL